MPFALVGYSSVGVIESTPAMHKVLLPIPAVLTTFVIVECAIAVSKAFHLSSFIPSLRKLLLDKGRLRHLDRYLAGDTRRRKLKFDVVVRILLFLVSAG